MHSSEATQSLAKLLGERISQNLLARAVRLVSLTVFATSCGPSQKQPIGCAVAGTGKALRVHKALQVVQRMGIELFPVAALAWPCGLTDARPNAEPQSKARGESVSYKR